MLIEISQPHHHTTITDLISSHSILLTIASLSPLTLSQIQFSPSWIYRSLSRFHLPNYWGANEVPCCRIWMNHEIKKMLDDGDSLSIILIIVKSIEKKAETGSLRNIQLNPFHFYSIQFLVIYMEYSSWLTLSEDKKLFWTADGSCISRTIAIIIPTIRVVDQFLH